MTSDTLSKQIMAAHLAYAGQLEKKIVAEHMRKVILNRVKLDGAAAAALKGEKEPSDAKLERDALAGSAYEKAIQVEAYEAAMLEEKRAEWDALLRDWEILTKTK